jgi:hypothetical protein
MNTGRTLLFAVCMTATIAGCGDDGTAGDDDDGSPSGTSSSGAGQGGDASSGGGIGATGATGSGGQGAQGGEPQGGAPGEVAVEMTVDPTTMPAGAVVQATITVQGFVLAAPTGQPNEDGEGHFHIYLDAAKGIDYLVADQSETVQLTIPDDTTPGAHTLRISLGENSHAPLDPPVEDIVDIMVTE